MGDDKLLQNLAFDMKEVALRDGEDDFVVHDIAEAMSRIREQRDMLEECEALIVAMRQEIQNLGGSLEGVITADATLAKLRGQEKDR